MSNLADIIEKYILGKLTGEQREFMILKRNELAEELNCAPSQISYVLSTRFTTNRGFIVESRRGAGGFVRIFRISGQQMVYKNAAKDVVADPRQDNVEAVVAQLEAYGLLSSREAELMRQFFYLTEDHWGVQDRARILRKLILRLADFS
ncbi:MAG: transcriptional repressor, CtsR [Firmicutes bacterium]|nr:transcriptional repressor, CtsR [Bacillota bacterium]